MHPGSPNRPAFHSDEEEGRASCVWIRRGKAGRLLRNEDFREAYDQNHSWHGRYFVLFVRRAEDACGRLGVVASKKVGNAVARSRAKRRLRELFRRHPEAFAALGGDVVLVARKAILKVKWSVLVLELARMLKAQEGASS